MLKPFIAAILLVAAAMLAGCGRGDRETRTETIAPAVPPPAAPSDDPGLTQTTEIGEERSPNEGGVLAGPGGEGVELEPPVTTTGSPPPQSN